MKHCIMFAFLIKKAAKNATIFDVKINGSLTIFAKKQGEFEGGEIFAKIVKEPNK